MSSQPAPGRRSRGGRGRPLVLALLAAALAGGCGGAAPPPGSPGGGPASSLPGDAASPATTGVPGPTPGPSGPPPTEAPPATRVPRSTARMSPELPTEPPAATLTGTAGGAVPGALGGYTWGDGGSDAPWIVVPAAGAAHGPGPWAIGFEPALPVAAWTAAWAPIGEGAPGPVSGYEEGAGAPPAFAGPSGGGPWTLKVEVRFGVAGRATYFWRLAGR